MLTLCSSTRLRLYMGHLIQSIQLSGYYYHYPHSRQRKLRLRNVKKLVQLTKQQSWDGQCMQCDSERVCLSRALAEIP